MRIFARVNRSLFKNIKEYKVTQNRFVFVNSVQARPCLQLEWDATKENVFNNINCIQQKRTYAPKTTTFTECWNCKKEHYNREFLMKCEECGYLQDVNTEINYFELLDLPQKFDLEAQSLTNRFRKLQTMVHPDKFSNKTSREQSNSAEWSSLINKAYKTLLIPLERGKYLLELNGLQMPQDNNALDKEFLMEMMERNEEVDNALTKNDLNAINDRIVQEVREKVESLSNSFSENNLETARGLLIEMKYLISIQKTIKNKLQNLLAG